MFWEILHWGTIDFTQETHQQAIQNRLGAFSPVRVGWTPSHLMEMRASLPWVFSLPAERGEKRALQTEVNDGDHILLFPQDADGLCPRAWLDAAWPFLQRFRANFSLYPQAVLLYTHVTLIGLPLGTRLGISAEFEEALRRDEWHKVERIRCSNAEELQAILQRRVEKGVPFRGEDEGR